MLVVYWLLSKVVKQRCMGRLRQMPMCSWRIVKLLILSLRHLSAYESRNTSWCLGIVDGRIS